MFPFKCYYPLQEPQTCTSSITKLEEHTHHHPVNDVTPITPINTTAAVTSVSDTVVQLECTGDTNITNTIPGVNVKSNSSIVTPRVIRVLSGQLNDILDKWPVTQNNEYKSVDQNVTTQDLTGPDGNNHLLFAKTIQKRDQRLIKMSQIVSLSSAPIEMFYRDHKFEKLS